MATIRGVFAGERISYSGMHRVVRPFVTIDSAPAAPPAPRKPLPGEDGEAFASWGGPSRFTRPDLTEPVIGQSSGGTSFKVEYPKDKEDKEAGLRTYSETSRETEEIRVENPEDSDQYVMVERIKTIDFSTPDGSTARFVLKWD